MKNTTLRRAALGVAALGAAAIMHACASLDVETDTAVKLKPPFLVPLCVEVSTASDGRKNADLSGGPSNANKCVEIVWSGADGQTLGTTPLMTDGSGSASCQVPEGAVRAQAKVADCPDPAPQRGRPNGGGMFDPSSPFGQLAQDGQQREPLAHQSPREFLIMSTPIVPTQQEGGDMHNLTYCFIVTAMSSAQADALIEPILTGGIGTPVHPSVVVVAYSTMESDAFGARLVQAQPGRFSDWSFDLNYGAFYADLGTTLNYQVNGWDVLEVAIPLSAFDVGTTPGVLYENFGVTTYSTDLLAEPVDGSFRFSFSH